MRWLFLIASALLTTLLATPSAARELWDRKWVEVRTEHFIVAGAVGEEDTTRLATELEGFRAAVSTLLNVRVAERVPTRVFIVPGRTRDLNLVSGVTGWFQPLMRENLAVVSEARGALSLSTVLYHEYTHFLVHNHSGNAYPLWFDEGFAELLHSLKVEPDRAFVGGLVADRRQWLERYPWMSFSRLIRVRSLSPLTDEDVAMFYAQSWALVHYLMLGPEKGQFAPRMTSYRDAVEAGEDEVTAYTRAFGEDPRRLERKVQRYLKSKKQAKIWAISLPERSAAAAPTVRAVPRDEIAARLGWVSMMIGDPTTARQAFGAALADNPDNARALVGIADLHKSAGRFDQAEPLYQRAIELEPDSATHKLDYGEYFYDRSRDAGDRDPARAADWMREARHQFASSHKLDDGIPETLAMNGACYLDDADGAEKAVASLQLANDMLPSHPRITFLLAQAYAKAGRKQDAARLIRSVVAWSHPGANEEAAALLRQLEQETTGEADTKSPEPDGAAEPR